RHLRAELRQERGPRRPPPARHLGATARDAPRAPGRRDDGGPRRPDRHRPRRRPPSLRGRRLPQGMPAARPGRDRPDPGLRGGRRRLRGAPPARHALARPGRRLGRRRPDLTSSLRESDNRGIDLSIFRRCRPAPVPRGGHRSMRIIAQSALVAAAIVLAAAAGHAQSMTDMKKGGAASAVQGAAGPSGAQGAASDLEHCDRPMGSMAVVQPPSFVVASLARYQLGSPTGLLRLMIQQSNCFLVVERGVGMQNLMQERALAKSGELRQGSNMGGGQMVTADFVMTPSVVFSEDDAGGVGAAVGALGGLLGTGGRVLGAAVGGLKFKEAQTSMLVADSRSGLQVAAAEGNASKADFQLGGFLAGAGVGGALGGYTNTNEGKMIAASFADN